MLAGYKSLNEWLMQVASDSWQHWGHSAMDVRMGGGINPFWELVTFWSPPVFRQTALCRQYKIGWHRQIQASQPVG